MEKKIVEWLKAEGAKRTVAEIAKGVGCPELTARFLCMKLHHVCRIKGDVVEIGGRSFARFWAN